MLPMTPGSLKILLMWQTLNLHQVYLPHLCYTYVSTKVVVGQCDVLSMWFRSLWNML